ncbi:MAG: hypothetical protein K0U98_01920 [Deltaproteobacteria bacterium]|nr:hypothetical protein [Deltaproteobacteria bacterium]
MFDGIPGLEQLEDGANAAAEVISDLGEMIPDFEDLGNIAEDVADFTSRFVEDPAGAVEGALTAVDFDDLVGVVGLGIDDLAGKVLTDVGLGPLVEGVSVIVDKIDEVVVLVLRGLKCVCWLEVPVFWTMVGALYGARVAKLVSSKDDCEEWLRLSKIFEVVADTQVPLAAILPCAIEAAFLTPLPSEVAPHLGADAGKHAVQRLKSGKIAAAVAQNPKEGLLSMAITPPPSIACVSRSQKRLDVMIVRADGASVCAAWKAGDPKKWQGWWHLANGKTHPGSPITVVSRSTDKLDVFMVGLDGRVWTAAWQPGDKSWRGWWPIGDLKVAPGSLVGAVSRSADRLDVFAVGVDGYAYTAAWKAGQKAGWRGWWTIAKGRALPGTPIAAVSRSTGKLDVFMVGLDERVWTAAWQPGDKSWRGWWPVGDLKTVPGSVVGVVARSPGTLDIFAVDKKGVARTAGWKAGRKEAWRGWWTVAKGRALPGTPIAAVSRSTDKLDVFMVGVDGKVWAAAWQPGDKSWRGWWPIGDLKVPHRALLSVICKQEGHLDVFTRGFDGAAYTAAWEAGRDKKWRGWWRLR